LVCASVALIHAGRVLLATRGKPPMDSLWSLPGGLVEPGETLGEAALRELMEEVGVEAKLSGVLPPVEVIERDAQGRVRLHFVIVPHVARWVSGDPRTGPEAREIRWVTEAESAQLPTTPGLPGILARAFALAGRPDEP
jgi:ADP-ribose pyrophosphatase YjhB (NUDIX family)